MKLQEWLVAKDLSILKFCKHHRFCKESLYSYVKGKIPRSEVAVKIVKATGGEVSLEDLGVPEKMIAKIKFKQQRLREKMERDKARRMAAKALE